MVSSSLDQSIKKTLTKEPPAQSDAVNININNNNNNYTNSTEVNFGGDPLASSEKIQLLFPKCKPRSDYQYQKNTKSNSFDNSSLANLISIETTTSQFQSAHMFNAQTANSGPSNFNMNNSKLMKLHMPISPDKQLPPLGHYPESSGKNMRPKHDKNESYAETNPFRIGNSNRYIFSKHDSIFENNNSTATTAASALAGNNKNMLHHYHSPSLLYQKPLDEQQSYYFKEDEVEHNPYVVNTKLNSVNTISPTILKATPPATPPALVSSPADSPSPHEYNRNVWDLSPIKTTTPTKVKTQSPSLVSYLRSQRGSYKKLAASTIPIEEDSEAGHFYYNNTNPYYSALQTDSDSNEPTSYNDVVKNDSRINTLHSNNELKMKKSESIYSQISKKTERKIVKSKSASGIMEYDGSPRRFGMSTNDEVENHYQPFDHKDNNRSSPSPPRPGFPQRIISYGHHQPAVTNQLVDVQSDDHKNVSPVPHYLTSSKLIPSTFIVNENFEAQVEQQKTNIEDETTDETSNHLKSQVTTSNLFPTHATESSNEHDRYDLENKQTNNSDVVFQVNSPTEDVPTSTFDYLYEFSETRKVLEEFFKCPDTDRIVELEKLSDFNESNESLDIQFDYRRQIEKEMESLSNSNKKNTGTPMNIPDDIDDDNRDDKVDDEDDEEEEAYLKTKQQNGFGNKKYTKEKGENLDYFFDSASRSSLCDGNVEHENGLDTLTNKSIRKLNKPLSKTNTHKKQSKNFNYSPDTTDYDSNYGDFDFDSESPLRFVSSDQLNMLAFNNSNTATVPSATVDLSGGPITNYARYCSSMPVLEDGLSSGHASDNENNNPVTSTFDLNFLNQQHNNASLSISTIQKQYQDIESLNSTTNFIKPQKLFRNRDSELESLYTINTMQHTPPPPAPVPHRKPQFNDTQMTSPIKQSTDIHSALEDIRTTLQKSNPTAEITNTQDFNTNNNVGMKNNFPNYYEKTSAMSMSPVWVPRSREKNDHSPVPNETNYLLSKNKHSDEEEEEIDTDLETDRLLGHQMLDDGFYNEKAWADSKQCRFLNTSLTSKISPNIKISPSIPQSNSSLLRHSINALLPTSNSSDCCNNNSNSPTLLNTNTSFHQQTRSSLKNSPSMESGNLLNLITASTEASPERKNEKSSLRNIEEVKQQEPPAPKHLTETPEHLENEIVDSPGGSSSDGFKKETLQSSDKKKKNKNKEVLIEGVLFRARYLGSTQLVCEGQPTKSTRMMQAEEAVSRIKAPDGENQPTTEVDLFISTEKIMVLNTDLKEIMMDHALRTISYIADIGDLVVLMARRRFVPQDIETNSDSGTGTGGSGNVSGGSSGPTPPTSGKINRTPKMICHVFESEEAQFIAQSIGQAFQVAYMEFLKANGIEDHSFMKEMDYQEVLNSQEIFGDELEIFAKKELQKEVVVPKAKGEILGVVIVESGWGSMLPTVVIANLASNGAAARCGQLNIGDQIIAINGLSLVGLPLSQCQSYIKNTKNQTVVKFTVVPCAPVVEVKIKRPNTKYQLGFSVQNGVICSLLRGGIAERGGVRVGHRIIEINNQSVVAVPHEKIVNLLATSVGEILMKTMPTSMFRLLTGQESPIYI
ncbi:CLUMA_CG004888, isoform A [Clunio marinus]|uniref:CLUMA_CG004888, isoform A n=1 Tax=Clunio marinus TaxID=568069 RepID=A0A1J1HT77_9DIPT|nr:CLUMA_CG004888, isoform A [Clunio marinus]